MPIVKRSSIDAIKERVSIVDVVSPYVNLKRVGVNFRGLSPFNEEKTPSFYVLPDKNIFKCFSSGYAGDVFRFLQLKENLSFQEAIESIAERFNIALEYEEGSLDGKSDISLRKEIFSIYEVAMEFFFQCGCEKGPLGDFFKHYWISSRSFSIQMSEMYKIGIAPVEKGRLLEVLLKKKFSREALQQCGLFYMRQDERDVRRFFERFRGRLMIPIRDVQGRCIAFTARQLDITPQDDPSREAKYINSPETQIFHKGQVLFGLDEARKHANEENPFLLVEGQLDVLRCWEAGFLTAIASQGTGINENQLVLMRRYTTKVHCLFDGDSAGQKAALRLMPMFIKVGLDAQFVLFEEGEDPDSYLRNQGRDAFQKVINQSVSMVTFVTKMLFSEIESMKPNQKAERLKSIYKILEGCESKLVLESYLEELSQCLKIPQSVIQGDFAQFKVSSKGYVIPELKNYKKDQEKRSGKLTTDEYELLLIVLHHEDLANEIAKVLEPEWIRDVSKDAMILNRILGEFREDVWPGIGHLHEVFEDEKDINYVYTLLSEKPPYENFIKTANDCIKSIFTKYIHEKKSYLEKKIVDGILDKTENVRDLQKKRLELRKMLQSPPQLSTKT